MLFEAVRRNNIQGKMYKLLTEYDHEAAEDGIHAILSEYAPQKVFLYNILRQDPHWDEDNLAIVFNQDYKRGIDIGGVNQFVSWVTSTLRRKAKEAAVYYCGKYFSEWNQLMYYYSEASEGMIHIKEVGFECQVLSEGKVLDIESLLKEACDAVKSFNAFHKIGGFYVHYTFYDWYEKNCDFLRALRVFFAEQQESNLATDDFATEVNEIFPELKAVAGQKISRIVGKYGKITGLDQVKEINENNGRDYGWNRQFAMFADAVNPITYTRHTIISINPLDYLTASFGHEWASCHTIDKHNYRGTENTYHGMYMSGTISYMLDKCSMVFYTVDGKYNGKEYWKQDKMQRCMFHFGNNVLVQGRVYPDGRDGGDGSLSSQFRNVMQMVLANCLEEPNLWTLKREGIGDYVRSEGTHYRDYIHYNDCTISFLKGKEYQAITIGHKPMCIKCGREHYNEGQLICGDCDYVCERCGDPVDPDDAIIIDGNVYCCERCAEEAGYVNTVDDGWHDMNDCIFDDYEDQWYYYFENSCVRTENGRSFINEENAREMEYEEDEDGRWYPISEMYYCERCERWISNADRWDGEHNCCVDCANHIEE